MTIFLPMSISMFHLLSVFEHRLESEQLIETLLHTFHSRLPFHWLNPMFGIHFLENTDEQQNEDDLHMIMIIEGDYIIEIILI